MLSSLLFFFCIMVNSGLIVYYLLPSLVSAAVVLGRGLRRSRLYLACRLDETRERALRQRSLKLSCQLVQLVFIFFTMLLAYGPSLLFAYYRSGMPSAVVSIEALAGMSAGAATVAVLRRRA